MDEMELLGDFCTAEPPPEPGQLARARARLITAIRDPRTAAGRRGGRRPPRHGARTRAWRRLAVAGTAAASATAIVIAAVMASPGPSLPTGGARPVIQRWSAGTATLSPRLAVYVLRHAAVAALTAPAPRDDQFIYTDTRAAGPGNDVVWRIQSWQSVDGMRAGATLWTKCMVASGSPPDVVTRVLPSCLSELPPGRSANPVDRTYAGLRTLPTRPAAMLAWLKQHNTCDRLAASGLPKDIAAYAEIFMILGTVETPPPTIAAALFGAAAQIPGVTVLRDAADAAGGHGVAVAMTFASRSQPRTMYELIFNPRTYRYIGQQQITMRSTHGPGKLMSAMSLVASKVVNTAPTDYTGNAIAGTPSCV